ncbi:hypothetical protein BDV93DRAFT_566425 [Ceratobasidium sp. AG-I]|nr:hypothetical protein BDV93DRAFT_566425 [Ceratobasidium sp. AG-I]
MLSSFQSLSLISALALTLISRCAAEPPNPLYQYHMNEATAVYNMTLFIIPYPKYDLQKLAGYPLLAPFPTADGTAPLVLQFGKLADIRQNVAQIPELMSSTVIIPFVDRLKNGKSPFSLSKYTFTDQIIPSAVSSLVEGYQNELASFTPAHEAYASDQGVLSFAVKQDIVPTPPLPVGGPGFSVPVFDATFTPLPTSQTPKYPQSMYEDILNGPIFGYGPECGTLQTFFNFTFTYAIFVTGDVTLYAPATGIKTHFPKTMQFTNVPGVTVTIAEIQGTFPPVSCESLV